MLKIDIQNSQRSVRKSEPEIYMYGFWTVSERKLPLVCILNPKTPGNRIYRIFSVVFILYRCSRRDRFEINKTTVILCGCLYCYPVLITWYSRDKTWYLKNKFNINSNWFSLMVALIFSRPSKPFSSSTMDDVNGSMRDNTSIFS